VIDRDGAIDWFRRPSRAAVLAMAVVLFAADQTMLRSGDGIGTAGPLDETAHFLTGALVLASLRGHADRSLAAGLLAVSVLIDVDHIPDRVGVDWITSGTPRPYTHSLLTIGVVMLAALLWRSGRSLLVGVGLGLAFHFYRDTSEPKSGVALLWPWSNHSYTSPHWIYLVIAGAVALVALWRARGQDTVSLTAGAVEPTAGG
jgi:membrane-bound metal-dependent hydrolase YbcI (DUF457 family)